jgi:hypothetical protein
MRIIGAVASLILISVVLLDGFETILQPRRVTHRFRFAGFFYRHTWRVWRGVGVRIPIGGMRQAFLSVFGPLSLLGLFATWITMLIVGFGLLHWSIGTPLKEPDARITLQTYLYLSGTTFVTLGYGDVTPIGWLGRTLAVVESGLGFAFLAVIIGYLPVLFQAYSRREVAISLLDARAGSPPSATQFLLRLARAGSLSQVDEILAEWEIWAAELLESHLSFPVLSYYRSQHDNQSWLAALTCILDTCAVLIVHVRNRSSYHAQLTFAMARHAAVDLSLVLRVRPCASDENRLPPERCRQMEQILREAGMDLHSGPGIDARLAELRGMYEPFVNGMVRRFLLTLPPILPENAVADNWQRAPGMPRAPGIGSLPAASSDAEHFG